MSAPLRRLAGVSGSETLGLLQGAARGSLVHVRREMPVVRPAVHVREYGRLIVRTPGQAAAPACLPSLTDHYRRMHDSHDTLVRIPPRAVAGIRLAHAEAVR
ncbi:pyridoxamine 5'-phosphate oxidase family protein [Streptomyces europaeiscabiei]|uniref:pyridoxamine 5'-phosphate oxidase family protein n=1 Tax=Streptomyces europaeiscabiei TaxID=146819 RepID=UPI0029B0EE79|nr:pyridoxamine 5'-phosphate oxidase family protein [Streptomyces europaeiscabiei]MDX2530983.1 pyridoxamine 5'-phosphate oxidase family protein [Streptomyces europaeiscabiei]